MLYLAASDPGNSRTVGHFILIKDEGHDKKGSKLNHVSQCTLSSVSSNIVSRCSSTCWFWWPFIVSRSWFMPKSRGSTKVWHFTPITVLQIVKYYCNGKVSDSIRPMRTRAVWYYDKPYLFHPLCKIHIQTEMPCHVEGFNLHWMLPSSDSEDKEFDERPTSLPGFRTKGVNSALHYFVVTHQPTTLQLMPTGLQLDLKACILIVGADSGCRQVPRCIP